MVARLIETEPHHRTKFDLFQHFDLNETVYRTTAKWCFALLEQVLKNQCN